MAGNRIAAESVWNQHAADTPDDSFGSSGGGISDFFPVPPYQAKLSLPKDLSTGKTGRGVPDVSADGDPASGYLVRVDGEEIPIGGTSAVAPLWAGPGLGSPDGLKLLAVLGGSQSGAGLSAVLR